MTLIERQLVSPGKEYKLSINCLAMRRLSAMEWLILTCINRFHSSAQMGEKTLKDVYETVFHIQDSHLLINPCIKELTKLGVIEIQSDSEFAFDTTHLKEITLTKLGDQMLADGMLPGEPRSIPVSVVYDPLTKKIVSPDKAINKNKDAYMLGAPEDYDDEFPEELIIQELQAGNVGSKRFVASQNLITETEVLKEAERDYFTPIIVSADDHGVITTIPEIKNDAARENLSQLFIAAGISEESVSDLIDISSINQSKKIGSGKLIEDQIINICQSGKFIIIDNSYYEFFKSIDGLFANKYIFVFNAPSFSVDSECPADAIVFIPEPFDVLGCAAINENNDSISICKAKYTYNGRDLIIPLAARDSRLRRNSAAVSRWFNSLIDKHASDNITYVALAAAPFLNASIDKRIKWLINRWKSMGLQEIVQDIIAIKGVADKLGFNLITEEDVGTFVVNKIQEYSFDDVFSNIGQIIDAGCLVVGSDKYSELVHSLLESIPAITNYDEILNIRRSLHIDSRDSAAGYDEPFDLLYNKSVLSDLISRILFNTFEPLEEVFEYDAFFNSYYQSIKQIELLVSGLDMFVKMDPVKLRESVSNCPDIARLQFNISQLSEKNSDLVDRDINVFDVMKKLDKDREEAYYSNTHNIIATAKDTINGIVTKTETEIDKKDGKENTDNKNRIGPKETVFVVDTCAMINRPELFQYFNTTEYIRIPTKAITELGNIKDRRYYSDQRLSGFSDDYASRTARALSKRIDSIYIDTFNQFNKALFIIENGDLDLLPPDIDSKTPDHIILSVALKYKEWDVHLITDDIQFRVLAKSQGIDAISGEDFISTHKQYYVEEAGLGIKYRKAAAIAEKEKKIEDVKKTVNNSNSPDRIAAILGAMKIGSLKQYIPELSDKLISYLQKNKIKTVAEYVALDSETISRFNATTKEVFLKNELTEIIKNKDAVIEKIKSKYGL